MSLRYPPSEADRRRELAVADILAAEWSVELTPTPELAGYDYLASRDGEPVGVVEVKTIKRYGVNELGGLLIDEHKRDALLAAAAVAGVRAALIVWLFRDGGLRWLDVRKIAGQRAELTLGRTDRERDDWHRTLYVRLSETSLVRRAA